MDTEEIKDQVLELTWGHVNRLHSMFEGAFHIMGFTSHPAYKDWVECKIQMQFLNKLPSPHVVQRVVAEILKAQRGKSKLQCYYRFWEDKRRLGIACQTFSDLFVVGPTFNDPTKGPYKGLDVELLREMKKIRELEGSGWAHQIDLAPGETVGTYLDIRGTPVPTLQQKIMKL